MPDPTEELFDRLNRLEHEALLENVEGTLRFDISHEGQTNHWLVKIDKGDVDVSRQDGDADCMVFVDKALFDRIARGEANAISALMRAEMIAHGNIQLLIMLERLLPGPPGARGPRRLADAGGRRS
jgi:putative sterol carrier protein